MVHSSNLPELVAEGSSLTANLYRTIGASFINFYVIDITGNFVAGEFSQFSAGAIVIDAESYKRGNLLNLQDKKGCNKY